jgi:hydroxymethylpyrimidine/phosphomethylpyrimidine kinase
MKAFRAMDASTTSPAASPSRRIPVVLSIAGSDSGGGAGIQADLKAFARSGVHGATAITAITAQSTVAVDAVEAVGPAMILAQVRAVAGDLGVDAVKIGMVGSVAAIEAVAIALDELGPAIPVVLDPVMIAESGGRLLEQSAEQALRTELLPRATVVTPNIAEARVLAGDECDATPEQLARAIYALGPRAVIVTGGHRSEPSDLLFDGEHAIELPGERHPDGAAHGSGCTHSSTLAAQLALGASLEDAARTARRIAGEAVRDGMRELGAGPGPVNVLGAGTVR